MNSRLADGLLEFPLLLSLCALLGLFSLPSRLLADQPPAFTLTDVTATSGIHFVHNTGGSGEAYIVEGMSAGLATLDYNGDGWMDIYFLNGAALKGAEVDVPLRNALYRNNGDGTFTDISVESGIAAVASPSMGIVCVDLDLDNDIDIYVCNDGKPNFFFQNDGSGVFEEVGLLYGLACDNSGKANASMGVDCGDYDQDGLLDLFVTDYQAEMPVLYHNLGQGLFEDATSKARIPRALFPHVNWGTAFADFDNDGDQDLYLVCGHFDRIEAIDDRTTMKVRNFVLLNDHGLFSDVTEQVDASAMHPESSRGLAVEDFDNDGDLDVLVGNANAGPTLLRNDSPAENHWIKLKLSQPGMNRDAIGARVHAATQIGTQIQHTLSGRGYQSHFGSLLHFGLASHDTQVKVIVEWPHDNAEGLVESQEELVPVNALTEISRNSR